MVNIPLDRRVVDEIVAGWPEKPREVARQMIAKYDVPAEATPGRLTWLGTGPWKRTEVAREEVPHNFPRPHTDLLQQFIDYRVPPQRCADLAAYDGSVIVERTKGELSARCDKEEMNFLALNLAHEIVTGSLTVDAAREKYAETAAAFMVGEQRPYTQRLQFEVPRGGTADPDTPAMGDAMKGMASAMVEKAKRALD